MGENIEELELNPSLIKLQKAGTKLAFDDFVLL